MINVKNFTPRGARVLLKRLEENNIKGGIMLPQTHEGKQLRYRVVSISPTERELVVGDTLIAPPDGGTEINVESEGKCEIIETRRVMAVL